jgi:hypothetical protein
MALAHKKIRLIDNKRIHNLATIVVSLLDSQEGLNIGRRVICVGNHKGLTNRAINVVGQKMESLIVIIGIDENRYID